MDGLTANAAFADFRVPILAYFYPRLCTLSFRYSGKPRAVELYEVKRGFCAALTWVPAQLAELKAFYSW